MTDAQAALAQVREALADEALFDDGASACDTLLAVRHFERVCALDNMTAILAHVEAQAAEIERLRKMLCQCDMRTRLVGDGCEFCNPTLADELAKEQR